MELIKQKEQYSIHLDTANNLIAMRFVGDLSDELYKEMWSKSLETVVEHKISNYLIDQQEIGNVSFSARAWVLVKILPQVRKQVGEPIFAAILPSTNLMHSTGMDFLAKGFSKLSRIYLQKFAQETSAIHWLQSESVVKEAG